MNGAESLPWSDFKNNFSWKQGEHVMAIAPTGAGKTTLLAELMPFRKFNLMFGTKLDDKVYRQIQRQGFRRVESIHDVRPWDNNVLLWPHAKSTMRETYSLQRQAFLDAMNTVMNQGSWTVWADEMKYMSQHLKLTAELTFMLEQLRSINGTIVGGAQRPKWLPLSALSNATHVFLWKTLLTDDAKRLSDIGGVDHRMVMDEMSQLGKHEFLYIRTRGTDARIIRTQVDRKAA